jgi:hypothetical protein
MRNFFRHTEHSAAATGLDLRRATKALTVLICARAGSRRKNRDESGVRDAGKCDDDHTQLALGDASRGIFVDETYILDAYVMFVTAALLSDGESRH